MRVHSFPPLIDERARVLVSGTAPSVKSLEYGQFYGHPQNYFWRVVYGLFGKPQENDQYAEPDPDYGRRVAFLQNNGLALWDIIAHCEREGSLDANIKEAVPNDFPGLLRAYPNIRCIAFNGSKAYDTFRKHYGKHDAFRNVALLKLPSTSPIPTKHMRSLEDRVEAWKAIVPYAGIQG